MKQISLHLNAGNPWILCINQYIWLSSFCCSGHYLWCIFFVMFHKMYCFFCHFSLLKIFGMCGFYIAWSFLPWFYINVASFSHVVSLWIFLRGKIFWLRCICVQAIGSLTMIFYFCPFSVNHQHWPWPYDSLPLSVVTCQGQSQEKVMII